MSNVQKNNYDVIVIGAGASGMMAAISASKSGARVLLIEHLNKVGKKILATGNGKCNYTNELQGVSFYRGDNPAFVVPVFEQFSMEDTVLFFKQLGIYPKVKNGYYYPYSEQAIAVVEVLELALKNHQVDVLTDCEILQMKNTNPGFKFQTTKGIFSSTACVFATGLLAGKKCGCDGSSFEYLKSFGHRFVDIVPALVQMKSSDSFLKNLSGIRADVNLKISVDEKWMASDSGELLHIDGGISGIVTFQLSRYAAKALPRKQMVKVHIDYCPSMSVEELFELLKDRFYQFGENKSALEAMIGFLNYKLVFAFFERLHIDPYKKAKSISTNELEKMVQCIKCLELDINDTKGFEDAQVCAGGLDTSMFVNESLESKLVPGLFACGELLDIDGMCGGYNLQWAWSSGFVAGKWAANYVKN